MLLFLTFSVLVANPKKLPGSLHDGQSRSWSPGQEIENNRESLAAPPPPPLYQYSMMMSPSPFLIYSVSTVYISPLLIQRISTVQGTFVSDALVNLLSGDIDTKSLVQTFCVSCHPPTPLSPIFAISISVSISISN